MTIHLLRISAWNVDGAMYRLGSAKLEQVEQALLSMRKQLRNARARQAGREASPNATVRSKWLQEGAALHRDTTAIARSLLGWKANLPEEPALIDLEMKRLLKEAISCKKAVKLEQFHVESQVVEFDKTLACAQILLKIRQAAEEYLEAAKEQVGHVSTATELTEGYLSQCSADFLEVQVAAKRAMQSGHRAAKAARRALKEVTQQVGLLADIMVDGGLVRYALQAAATAAAESNADKPHPGDESTTESFDGVPDVPVQRGYESKIVLQQFQATISRTAQKRARGQVSTLLQMPELFHVLHLSMLTQLAEWMPPVLPKAQAAFKLALHLHHRHDMHGLARSGGQDARLMQSAWQRLNAELQEMAGESRVLHTALGALFAQQMNEVLTLAAPAPENCTRIGQEGWMLWAATPSDPTVSLLKVPLGFYDMML
ncbi:unnamed protein product [Symbiodinium natans]|uniref:Uncharacterized protein n=1 Tax=Symbiodinium natans TaxID=878477 RepID=A0A812TY37_9DINO|nr:unnamed protein product [Symbiodinium natans]